MDHQNKKSLQAKFRTAMQPKPPPTVCFFEPSKESKKKLVLGKFGLLDLKIEQIADNWTLLDMRNFMQIKPEDFLCPSEAWNTMLQRSVLFTRWVTSEIVQIEDLSQRVEILRRFINIAMKFLENNNFNGLMCVWGGINTVAVYRLTKTAKKLPRKEQEIYHSLEKKLDGGSLFFQLRQAISNNLTSGEPTVPWFELINKLRNQADQYPDYVDPENHFVNFSKMQLLGEQILTFQKQQAMLSTVSLYHDENVIDKTIRSYLEHLPTFSDDVLWRFSCRCESEEKSV